MIVPESQRAPSLKMWNLFQCYQVLIDLINRWEVIAFLLGQTIEELEPPVKAQYLVVLLFLLMKVRLAFHLH